MPSAPQRSCRFPRCAKLTTDGWCDEHRTHKWDRSRESSSKRGYGRAWQKFRVSYLQRHPLCVDCLSATPSMVTVAREIHHVDKLRDRPDLQYVDSNLMSLCTPCHSRRSQAGE